MAFLEIQGVKKSFGENEVLKGIDLPVEEHSVVCLVGPSGCGKSTLLRCINRLEQIDGGAIYLCGEEISGPGINVNAVRRAVGIVFQSYNLFPHMTVLENVTAAPRRVLRVRRQRAEEDAMRLLERFGLADKAPMYPDSLSGGQQQRAAIVRALAMDPMLLLLDEVTSALDPELTGEVLEVIRQLAIEGMTLMLATHELEFARAVARKICFMYEGIIHEEGTPAEILDNPRNPRTQAFVSRLASKKK